MHIKHIHEALEKLSQYACEEASKDESCIDTEELGAVVDMIKDLCGAEYHARIAKSMEEADEEESEAEKYMLRQLVNEYGEDDGRRFYDNYRFMKSGRFAPKGSGTYTPRRGYSEPYWHMTPDDYHEWKMNRDMDRYKGKMYFSEPITADGQRHSPSGDMVNHTESRIDRARRMYTETKQVHNDGTPESKQARMKDLEAYMTELNSDLTELIKDMSAEERALVKNKVSVLATKL